MPRDTLTVEQIVAAAIELLDSDGLDGLNMRALGQRLGSAATAIYWHIKTKDELVQLAGDAIWAEIELPELEATDWRTAATELAVGLHGMLTRHPWFGQAFGSYLLYGPGKSRYDDRTLAVYDRAGFAQADADRAAATVFIFVVGSALGTAANVSLTRRLARSGRDPEQAMQEALAKAHDVAADFPHLRARLTTPAAAGYLAGPDSAFEFGLRSILDGLQARLISP